MIRNQEVDDDKEAIIRQYSAEDKSTVELAEEYDVAPNTIRNRLKEWDVDIRSVGQRYGWLDDCLDSIVEQYVEQGDSLQTIADQYGTTTSPIKNGFRKQASNFVPPTIRSRADFCYSRGTAWRWMSLPSSRDGLSVQVREYSQSPSGIRPNEAS